MPMRVGIALGSNLGERLTNLRRAREAILGLSRANADSCLTAPIYQTAPVDCAPGAGYFLNSAMEIEYSSDLDTLLRALRGVETDLGRPQQHGINESRQIDLDILYADDLIIQTPELTVPHPRMLQRRFVLAPLAAIRPGLILPGQGETVADILAGLEDNSSSVALADEQW